MNIRSIYHELILASLFLNIMDALLTAFAIFSIGFFIICFYRLSIFTALSISIIFFIRSLIIKLRQNKILVLEKKYPDLKEKLRTSFDYQDKSNYIVDDLHSEIAGVLRQIDINAYLNNYKIIGKIFITFILFSATLYFASVGLDVNRVTDTITSTGMYKRASKFTQDLFKETRDETKDRALLDKPRLISSGDTEVNLSIQSFDTELDINSISNSEKNDYGGHYPEEIAGASQETYNDKIPEEYKDVIKEYFKKINK
jgi:hypothetical protein